MRYPAYIIQNKVVKIEAENSKNSRIIELLRNREVLRNKPPKSIVNSNDGCSEEDIRRNNQLRVNPQEERNVLGLGGGEIGVKKQNWLYEANVMVVGSGPLAQMVLVNLAGLGIGVRGCITIVDNSRIKKYEANEFLYKRDPRKTYNKEKIYEITSILKKINKEIKINAEYSKFVDTIGRKTNPQIIIEATNDTHSKEDCFGYAFYNDVPFISASSDKYKGIITTYEPYLDRKKSMFRTIDLESILNKEFLGQSQGNVSSGVIGGISANEIVRNIFRLAEGKDDVFPHSKRITYNLYSHERTGLENDLKPPNIKYDYSHANVLVVGCGALGNSVALFCALNGFGNIDFIDADYIEGHNPSRQVLFYQESVGEYKAKVLSNRVKEINSCKSTPHIKKFTEQEEDMIARGNKYGRYNVVFSCVDRWKPRYILNELCVKHSVPLINGGTNPIAGIVQLYYPRETYCIDCSYDLKTKADNEKDDEITSCARVPDPSIIMPNFIAGAAMVAESLNVLSNKKENLLKGSFLFQSTLYDKIYLSRPSLTGKDHICRQINGA